MKLRLLVFKTYIQFYKLSTFFILIRLHIIQLFILNSLDLTFLVIILIMLRLILILITLPIFSTNKEPILELPLTFNSKRQLQTIFSLGPSQVRVQVDLNDKGINICCKNKNSLSAKIYYFMLNPFRPYQDYNCNQTSPLQAKDIAKFSKIGPVTVNFRQITYPNCQIGLLGFSKNSDFLAILPSGEQFFTIQRENGKLNEKKKWKLRVGGAISSNVVYKSTGNESQWAIPVHDISFNQISLGTQNVTLTTQFYEILIPESPLRLIQSELMRNFQCTNKYQTIYCPCNRGISKSFPAFNLNLNGNETFKLLPEDYLDDQDQICKVLIRKSPTNYWSVNVLMFDNADLIFKYGNPMVGIASHRLSLETNDSIKEPLQIILNSVVILLMCLFVAMILIEFIKHFTGIESASSESFENYMLKHVEQ